MHGYAQAPKLCLLSSPTLDGAAAPLITFPSTNGAAVKSTPLVLSFPRTEIDILFIALLSGDKLNAVQLEFAREATEACKSIFTDVLWTSRAEDKTDLPALSVADDSLWARFAVVVCPPTQDTLQLVLSCYSARIVVLTGQGATNKMRLDSGTICRLLMEQTQLQAVWLLAAESFLVGHRSQLLD